MSAHDDLTIPLLPGQYYHIFNRGIGDQNIFYQARNFEYFLSKYFAAMHGYASTYAYCLLENHFHILIRVHEPQMMLERAIKDFERIDRTFYKEHLSELTSFEDPELLNFKNLAALVTTSEPNLLIPLCTWAISERLRRFILGYAKAINIQESRNGSLFQKVFRRKLIEGFEDKKIVLAYILRNPIHHNCCKSIADYPWSSYHDLMTPDTKVNTDREGVLNWFGGIAPLYSYLQSYTASYHKWVDVENF